MVPFSGRTAAAKARKRFLESDFATQMDMLKDVCRMSGGRFDFEVNGELSNLVWTLEAGARLAEDHELGDILAAVQKVFTAGGFRSARPG